MLVECRVVCVCLCVCVSAMSMVAVLCCKIVAIGCAWQQISCSSRRGSAAGGSAAGVGESGVVGVDVAIVGRASPRNTVAPYRTAAAAVHNPLPTTWGEHSHKIMYPLKKHCRRSARLRGGPIGCEPCAVGVHELLNLTAQTLSARERGQPQRSASE